MNTLSKDQIAWAYVCGLPINLGIYKMVIDYARGDSSEAEYSEYYNRLSDAQKTMADTLIIQTDREITATQAGQRK
jgi:hypothetical protein